MYFIFSKTNSGKKYIEDKKSKAITTIKKSVFKTKWENNFNILAGKGFNVEDIKTLVLHRKKETNNKISGTIYNNKESNRKESHTVWNTSKPNGWATYKLLSAESPLMDAIATDSNEDATETIAKLLKAQEKVKYQAFEKIRVSKNGPKDPELNNLYAAKTNLYKNQENLAEAKLGSALAWLNLS